MDRNLVAGVYLVGLAFGVGYYLARRQAEQEKLDALHEHERREEEGLWRQRVNQALSDLHGRIDAEKWLAGGPAEGVEEAPSPA